MYLTGMYSDAAAEQEVRPLCALRLVAIGRLMQHAH